LTTYLITRETTGYDWSHDQFFNSRVRADFFLDVRRRTEEFGRLLCIENEGDEPIEIAHVRDGVLYEGLTSEVNWADTGHVVDIWERAKKEILRRWEGREVTQGLADIIKEVIRNMGLPVQWSDRLQAAVLKMEPEIESSLVSEVDEWPSIPLLTADTNESQ
jgi:hypothetical protein